MMNDKPPPPSPPKIYDDWKEAREAVLEVRRPKAKSFFPKMKAKAALKALKKAPAPARPFTKARGQKRDLDDDEDDTSGGKQAIAF